MTKKISIRIEEDLNEILHEMADNNHISFSEQAVLLINKGLASQEADNNPVSRVKTNRLADKYGDESRYTLRLCLESLSILRVLVEGGKLPDEFDSFESFYKDSHDESIRVLNKFSDAKEKNQLN